MLIVEQLGRVSYTLKVVGLNLLEKCIRCLVMVMFFSQLVFPSIYDKYFNNIEVIFGIGETYISYTAF